MSPNAQTEDGALLARTYKAKHKIEEVLQILVTFCFSV
jgi:hypothetical protein